MSASASLRPQPPPRLRGLHIEALDLADAARRGALDSPSPRRPPPPREGAARCSRTPVRRHPRAAGARRRRIGARQRGELALEALEAQIDLEPPRVLDEQRARELDVRRRRGDAQVRRPDRCRASLRLFAVADLRVAAGIRGHEIAHLRDQPAPAGRARPASCARSPAAADPTLRVRHALRDDFARAASCAASSFGKPPSDTAITLRAVSTTATSPSPSPSRRRRAARRRRDSRPTAG